MFWSAVIFWSQRRQSALPAWPPALPEAGSECNVHFDLATTFGFVYVDVLRYIRNGAHVQTSDGSSEARRMYGSHVPRSDVAAASRLGLIEFLSVSDLFLKAKTAKTRLSQLAKPCFRIFS